MPPLLSLLSLASLLSLLVLLGACGGGGGGGDAGGGSPAPVPDVPGVAGGRYFPLALGDRWRSAEAGVLSTDRVVGTQVVDGRTVTVVRTQEFATATGTGTSASTSTSTVPSTSTDSYYAKTDAAVTAVPTASDDAYTRAIGPVDLMRFPLAVGNSHVAVDKVVNGVLDLDGDGRFDTLNLRITVEVIGFERVDTPAGSFDKALHLRSVLTQTATLSANGATATVVLTSDDWYGLDVGPVRSVTVTTGAGTSSRSESLLQAYKVGALRSESVAPTVLTRTPGDGSVVRSAVMRVSFSEAMEAATLPAGGLTVTGPGGAVPGRAVWDDDRNLSFVADAALASGSYTVNLAAGVEDFAGNPLAAGGSWRFAIDNTGPKITALSPAANAIEVPLDSVVKVTFDEPPTAASVNSSSFWLEENGSRIAASLSLAGQVVTITPAQPLQRGATYDIWVGPVRDALDNFQDGYSSFRFKADPGRFAAPLTLASLGVATSLELADVDGDGRPDVLAAEGSAQGQGRVLLQKRQADGTLAATAQALPVTAGCYPTALAAADLDGDGLVDVAVSSFGCGIEILRQTAGGVWVNQGYVSRTLVNDLRVIALAGQARPGLVATVGGRVVLFRPAAGGGYQAPVDLYAVGYSMGQIEIGDVNGDGRPDIVVAGALDVGSGLVVALQRADGGFDVGTEPITNGTSDLAIGDVNGDGRADIVYPQFNPPAVVVRLQTAQGRLAEPVFLPAPLNPIGVRVADVNGDGRADIVLGQDGGTDVAVYLQTAAGTLSAASRYEAPRIGIWGLRTMAVADLTGDGLADILVGPGLLRQRVQAAPAAAGTGIAAKGAGRRSAAAAASARLSRAQAHR